MTDPFRRFAPCPPHERAYGRRTPGAAVLLVVLSLLAMPAAAQFITRPSQQQPESGAGSEGGGGLFGKGNGAAVPTAPAAPGSGSDMFRRPAAPTTATVAPSVTTPRGAVPSVTAPVAPAVPAMALAPTGPGSTLGLSMLGPGAAIMVDALQSCGSIANSGRNTMMVPWRSQAEWSGFMKAAAANAELSVASCCPPENVTLCGRSVAVEGSGAAQTSLGPTKGYGSDGEVAAAGGTSVRFQCRAGEWQPIDRLACR